MAETIAYSPFLTNDVLTSEGKSKVLSEYLDSLKEALGDIDVISVVNKEGIRIYHSNHSLIGTIYDGVLPAFESDKNGYDAVYETGPSGTQRRAYAAIYDENGDAPWRKDLFSEEVKQENVVVEQITSETDIQSLDSKLEQASAQIAALQKEVEQLKKQQPDS